MITDGTCVLHLYEIYAIKKVLCCNIFPSGLSYGLDLTFYKFLTTVKRLLAARIGLHIVVIFLCTEFTQKICNSYFRKARRV